MFDRLTNTLIASADLLEAEGRLAKRHAASFAAGWAVFVALLLALCLGVAALLAGLTWALAVAWNWPGALSLVGSVLALGSFGGLFWAYAKMR